MISALLRLLFGERKPGPRFHYPPRYKYTCYGCGGPLSAENASAGKDCGRCQSRGSSEDSVG